jgi:transposase
MPTANGQTTSSDAARLLVAFELGERSWKMGCSVGLGQTPRMRSLAAGAMDVVVAEIARAKRHFALAPDAPVLSCYEAGRVGFWLHRWLVAHGVTNTVVDSSSIEVSRRARRTKTDRLDLGGLLRLLARYAVGDHRAWRVVRVPTVAEEDARHLSRSLATCVQDRTRLINRLKGLLATAGVRLPLDAAFLTHVASARLWDGSPLPPGLVARLTQEWRHLADLTRYLRTAQATRVPDPQTRAGAQIVRLEQVRAIGRTSAWVLTTELWSWRQLRNRRQLAALVGLVPGRYQSGETTRDTGITRAGNAHVRRVMVQLAWAWLRYQPQSALAQWYARRFAGSTRIRRIGIIAVARKLLIALWHYVEHGVVPAGALLKPAMTV